MLLARRLALDSRMILAWLPETLMGLCICPKPGNQADLPRLRLQMRVPNQAYRRWYCFRKLPQRLQVTAVAITLQKATLTGATHAMRARTDVCRCQEKRLGSGGTVL